MQPFLTHNHAFPGFSHNVLSLQDSVTEYYLLGLPFSII